MPGRYLSTDNTAAVWPCGRPASHRLYRAMWADGFLPFAGESP